MALEGPAGEISLERRPLEVLLVLLESNNEVVSKEEILDRVWSGLFTVENVVANAVAKLRRALGAEAAAQIVTHPRVGYRFAGDVERTALGRRLESVFRLKVGEAAPLRERFELIEQISAGASREVWRGRHRKTGESRIFKYARDGLGLASIKREITVFRLALASEREAPVARLIDWNLSDDPFFLEVEDSGVTLQAVLSSGEARVPRQETVSRMAEVADAVDRMHDLGTVHGDLKPSNVCVTKDGEVRLIDFGSAQVLEPALLNSLGVTPLGLTRSLEPGQATPIYIAPERFAGTVATPAGDVYALGVMLYQALTGEFEGPLPADWRGRIDCPVLAQDIEEATRSDPQQRLSSAGALATRLRSLETRQRAHAEAAQAAVRARQLEEAMRAARARRPWLVATGAALVVGLAASLFLAFQARNAAEDARLRGEELAANNAFLSAMMRAGDPRTPGPGAEARVVDIVDHARTLLEEPRFQGPGLQIQLREVLADIHVGLAMHDGEIALRNELVERLREGSAPGALALAQFGLAEAYMRASRFEDSLSALEQAEALTGNLDFPELQARRWSVRGRYHLARLEFTQAAPAYEAALAVLEALPDPDLGLYHGVLQDLAQCYSRFDRHDEAIAILQRSLAPPFASGGVAGFRLAASKRLLGAAHIYARRYAQAERLLLEASRELSVFYGEASTHVQEVDNDLAVLYADLGRWEEAAERLDRLRALNCERYGERHMRCLAYTGNAGVTMVEAGAFGEAGRLLAAAHAGFQEVTGPQGPATQLMAYHLASALMGTGATQRAAQLIDTVQEPALQAAAPTSRWDVLLPLMRAWIGLRLDERPNAAGEQILREHLARLAELDPDHALLDRVRADLEAR